jgi:ATP-dependent Clp protease, protease subunit
MEEIIEIKDDSEILASQGVHLIFGDIDTDVARQAVKFILEMNFSKNAPENLTFVINSPGGDLTDCFAIIDAMRGSRIPVHTLGIGEVASSGLMIFIAGAKGHRTLTENTSILSHQWVVEGSGTSKEHELIALTKDYEITAKKVMKHYKICTGLSEKIIREYLLPPQDAWLNAKEAKRYKLCDKIVKNINGVII